jgi:Trypsin-like peptidase domain
MILAAVAFLGAELQGQESDRITPAVSVISDVKSAILPLFTRDDKNGQAGAGSCAVIHSSGFLLTADHVTTTFPGVVLFGLDRVEYEAVGRIPERDVAILKLKDASRVDSVIPLGSSNDLRIGEPIVVGGNPSGRGIVFTQGNINSASIEPSWPNVLIKSFWRNETQEANIDRRRTTGGRPDFIRRVKQSRQFRWSGGEFRTSFGRTRGNEEFFGGRHQLGSACGSHSHVVAASDSGRRVR